VPLFQQVSRPSFPGIQTLRELLAAKYPAAGGLKASDIADSSFVDEPERNGFIAGSIWAIDNSGPGRAADEVTATGSK
jgi:hypothetical protein